MDLMNETDSEFIARIDGLYVGQLTPDEQRWFDDCCEAGLMCRHYDNDAAFLLGIAKARSVQRTGAGHE